MDVLFPYLPRVTNTPVESNNRLILPVSKYQRIHGEASTEQQYRVGMRDPRRHQQEQQQQEQDFQQGASQQEQQAAAETGTTELHLLPTGHAVTPEQDQHADADGHLDIYI
jgi:hypothetical protein